MEKNRRLAGAIAGASSILGVLADVLLRGAPLGINAFLWTTVFVAGLVLLFRRSGTRLPAQRAGVFVGILLCAVLLLWRDSEGLRAMTVLFMMIMTGTVYVGVEKRTLGQTSMLEYVHGFFLAAVHSAVGAGILWFGDLRPERTDRKESPRVWSVARGAGIALPALLLFGSLFMAADAVFQRTVESAFDFDIALVLGHTFAIGFAAWVVAGFFRGRLIASNVRLPEGGRPKFLYVGAVEAGTFLGLVNVLFAGFVLVQVRYLFGGADLVMVTPGLTYADYARRGFFELVGVSALSLPMLLLTDWVVKGEDGRTPPGIRGLMGIDVALLVTIMVSAAWRIFLYQSEYGLTESRVYAAAFMVWILLVLGWFIVTVLRGERSRFAFGLVAAGGIILVSLYAMNPEDLIARTNIARATEGKPCDAKYLSQLGSDAVPVLIGSLGSLPSDARPRVAGALLNQRDHLASLDWRSANLSRSTAYRLLESKRDSLQMFAGENISKEE